MTACRVWNPITNQYFSLTDGSQTRCRVCWYNEKRPILVGVRHTTRNGMGRERVLTPDSRRWRKILKVAVPTELPE